MSAELEKRIAAALTGDVTSSALADLMSEAEAGIPLAQAAVEEARKKMLDPRKPVDAQTRQAVQDAELLVGRLQASLPLLAARLRDAVHAEEVAKWRPQYEGLKAQRDALADRLRDLYTPVVTALPPLLAEIEALDVKIRLLNMAAPSDGAAHLASVEEAARGQLTASDMLICRDLKLPPWKPGAVLLWPPYRGLDPATITPMTGGSLFQATDEWWRRAG